jgi:RNA polymerase sigma-70 factor, ECF subfamily
MIGSTAYQNRMSRGDRSADKSGVGLSLNADGPLSGANDQALVHAIRNGRPEALGILFDRYWRLVFDIARKVLRDGAEAEDLVQDVFLEIFRKAHLYDAARGSVKIWLLQYAYHRSFNRRKYLAVRSFYDASPAAALVHLELVSTRSGREEMSDRDWREVLERGLKELNHNERQIIELIAFEGFTVREASKRMDQSYVNGRNYYYRALKKLREFLSPGQPRSATRGKQCPIVNSPITKSLSSWARWPSPGS